MNATHIASRTDLETYLADTRPDVADLGKFYVPAVCDRIQDSSHPAWGSDWSEWLAEWVDSIITETVESIEAIGGAS